MWNSFPYDSWLNADGSLNTDISGFWTWGPGSSTGTYILTALGIALMIVAFIGFVLLEKRKVEEQAAMLKSSGALDRPTHGMAPGA
jgi:hypothetical protein